MINISAARTSGGSSVAHTQRVIRIPCAFASTMHRRKFIDSDRVSKPQTLSWRHTGMAILRLIIESASWTPYMRKCLLQRGPWMFFRTGHSMG